MVTREICVGDKAVRIRARFSASHRGATETHLLISPRNAGGARRHLAQIEGAYYAALQELGIPPETAVFRRLFASDLVNQTEMLRASPLGVGAPLSLVEQPPLLEAKVALHAYHVHDPQHPTAGGRAADGATEWRRHGLLHVVATGLTAPAAGDAYAQTHAIFQRFAQMLEARGMRLDEDALRTWIYVQNLDTDYQGVVRARREFFSACGLTADTHYIASTGIAGGAGDPAVHVAMDVYAVRGLRPGQVQYLEALDHLSPTHRYGVTFERGTAITYGDRRHLLLSGTASIDADGQIVHPGDVVRQLHRTLENMQALLRNGGADLDDMTHLLVYLRDPSDCRLIERALRRELPDLPYLMLQAPVCRPGWLIELEGTAVKSVDTPEYAPF